MTQDYLVQKVEEEQMIKTSSRCKDFLIEAMKYHLLKTEQKAIFKTPRTLPRTPLGLPKVRYLFFCLPCIMSLILHHFTLLLSITPHPLN